MGLDLDIPPGTRSVPQLVYERTASRRDRNQYRVSHRRPPALAKNGLCCRHRNCAEQQPHHPPPTGRKDLGLAGANASRRNAQSQRGAHTHGHLRHARRTIPQGLQIHGLASALPLPRRHPPQNRGGDGTRHQAHP